jgi:hypothetical protein
MMKGLGQLEQGKGLKVDWGISVGSGLISFNLIFITRRLTPIVEDAPMELARAVILPVPPGLGIAPLSDGALILHWE